MGRAICPTPNSLDYPGYPSPRGLVREEVGEFQSLSRQHNYTPKFSDTSNTPRADCLHTTRLSKALARRLGALATLPGGEWLWAAPVPRSAQPGSGERHWQGQNSSQDPDTQKSSERGTELHTPLTPNLPHRDSLSVETSLSHLLMSLYISLFCSRFYCPGRTVAALSHPSFVPVIPHPRVGSCPQRQRRV